MHGLSLAIGNNRSMPHCVAGMYIATIPYIGGSSGLPSGDTFSLFLGEMFGNGGHTIGGPCHAV